MRNLLAPVARGWSWLSPALLPLAEAGTSFTLARLLRLSLFQVSVMIVELGVPAWIVALMVALPLVLAPFRAVVGFRSDTHRSVLGWRRLPYLWLGTLVQFGGLAIMPFALLVLSGSGETKAIHIG